MMHQTLRSGSRSLLLECIINANRQEGNQQSINPLIVNLAGRFFRVFMWRVSFYDSDFSDFILFFVTHNSCEIVPPNICS